MDIEWTRLNYDLAKGLIVPLNKLINRSRTWPGDDGYLKSYEDWLEVLVQIRDGFQAFVDIHDMNYGLSEEQWDQYTIYTRGFKYTDGEKEYVTERIEFGKAVDHPNRADAKYWTFESVWEGDGPEPTDEDKRRGLDELTEKKNRGLQLFAEYFDSLWD